MVPRSVRGISGVSQGEGHRGGVPIRLGTLMAGGLRWHPTPRHCWWAPGSCPHSRLAELTLQGAGAHRPEPPPIPLRHLLRFRGSPRPPWPARSRPPPWGRYRPGGLRPSARSGFDRHRQRWPGRAFGQVAGLSRGLETWQSLRQHAPSHRIGACSLLLSLGFRLTRWWG